ncbi:hypothetical protein ABZ801_39635 [Actinomadura sp. NPDC047616]|uniref:hypothetical protein n=1 Tax=Actinomadura sp. NPDC047616 TaxID=3155914 RepID=UPI0033CDB21A
MRPSPPASPPASPTPTVTPNGIERLRPAQILARARAATVAASSLRLHGGIREDGENIQLDMRYAGRTRATGEMTTDGQRLFLTRVGPAVYIKGDDAFWKAAGGKGAVQLLSGKYLKATAKDEGWGELAAFADQKKFLTEMLKGLGPLTEVKGGTTRIDGRAALALQTASKDRIYVATEGLPYLLRLEGGRKNRMDLSAFGAPVTVQAPPRNQVVEVSALQ